MKLKDLFAKSVQIGMDADPRGKKIMDKMLKKYQSRFVLPSP
jgi:hypothetical protein